MTVTKCNNNPAFTQIGSTFAVLGHRWCIRRYSIGGFHWHPIRLGDVVSSQKGQYRVLDEVPSLRYGWPRHSKSRREFIRLFNHPSTFHNERYVALKICIADADPNHKLEIFNKLSRTPPVPLNVLQLLDHFSLQGPNGGAERPWELHGLC